MHTSPGQSVPQKAEQDQPGKARATEPRGTPESCLAGDTQDRKSPERLMPIRHCGLEHMGAVMASEHGICLLTRRFQ